MDEKLKTHFPILFIDDILVILGNKFGKSVVLFEKSEQKWARSVIGELPRLGLFLLEHMDE